MLLLAPFGRSAAKTMIKILFVSIIIMLYEYGLKKSVSTLQKGNYAPKNIKTLASLEI